MIFFLNVPDLAAGDGLIRDALGLLEVELGLITGALGGVDPLLEGHWPVFAADVFGQLSTSCYYADGNSYFSCSLEVSRIMETRIPLHLCKFGIRDLTVAIP